MRRCTRKQENTLHRLVAPLFDPHQFIRTFPKYVCFVKDLIRYSKLNGAEKIAAANTHPCLHDKTQTTSFDAHYFYQDIWAFKKIHDDEPDYNVDVGSRVDFVGFLTAITKVVLMDIRPLIATLDNFDSVKGSILSMPFKSDSIVSLSCLHVAEHIGLGRYGDLLDPLGTKKACKELARILAPAGNLYFSLPVGKPKLCFNAHRIHSPKQIIEYFNGLEIVNFCGIDDEGNFRRNVDMSTFENATYACGLFHFTKKSRQN
jgi:hypothetical protein